MVAQFPQAMGSSHDPLPLGKWKILGASYNPVFHYNASLFWDADDKTAQAVLPPGPSRPVGTGRSGWSGSISTSRITASTARRSRRGSAAARAMAASA